jgi:2',3'-cyclic-nucleotide 2'-phosphodiesterase/3'-nucleotidase
MNQRTRHAHHATLYTVVALSLVGCGHQSGPDTTRTGLLNLAVDGASTIVVDSVGYGLTGPEGYAKSGAIDTHDSATVSTVIGGIPAGTGYIISLSATSRDRATTCAGSAGFDIVSHTTTAVTVHLSCRQQPRTGSVSVNGTFNICPMIDAVSANPAAVQLGGTIALTASAHDDGIPSTLTYAWTATSGSYSDASSPSPTFTCAQVGAATLTLAVSDSDCADTSTLTVNCTLPTGSTVTLALLESTDIHQNIMSYDYYKLAPDSSLGFERMATLIDQARAQFSNNLLIDDGDTIQGTPLGDYQALVSPVPCASKLAVYKAMDLFRYDVGNVGNHEFNYGLAYLSQVTGQTLDVDPLPAVAAQSRCAGPAFPIVLANVVSQRTGKTLFDPYTLLGRTFAATLPGGGTAPASLNVGVIGFTPPTILAWDKRWLDGNIYTTGLKETAERFIPEMRSKGADVVVAVSHGGLDNSTYNPTMENGSWWLTMAGRTDTTQPALMDALLIGHSHQIFPNATSTVGQFNLPGVDKVKGLVNGVPTVMANYWGKHLGVVQLTLVYDGRRWAVDPTKTVVEARSIQNPDKTYVSPEPLVAAAVAAEHQATLDYVKTPIGTSDFRMTTYFADVGEVGAVEIVNQAQTDYVKSYIQANLPQYADLPVLSVSAPFKSGFAGGSDYTDVAAGAVAINNAADLYLYANTIYAVKVTGADVKAWLETAAKRFNTINPTLTTAQALVSTFPGYNFDMFTSPDLQYQIDVTKAVGSRIVNFTYKGVPVDATASFIVATNNYRASGGGNFPGLDGSKTIIASPDASRDVLISYIKKTGQITRAANGSDRSWSFAKVDIAGPVTFTSATGMLPVAQAAGLTNVSLSQANVDVGNGLSLYTIDLGQ